MCRYTLTFQCAHTRQLELRCKGKEKLFPEKIKLVSMYLIDGFCEVEHRMGLKI